MDVVDFKSRIWDLLRDVTETMDAVFRPVADQYGLTVLHLRILLEARQSDHTVGSLGKTMCIAGANTSSLCKRLEQEGFLERTRDARDERIVHIVLSEKGRTVLMEIEGILQKKFAPLLEAEQEDVSVILDGLGRLGRLLHKIETSGSSETGLKRDS